jgi:hypothetical protein
VTNITLIPTPEQLLKLRRLEMERAAICQQLGIEDDGDVDVPMFVAALVTDCRTSHVTAKTLGEKFREQRLHIERIEGENAALRLQLNQPREATITGGGEL